MECAVSSSLARQRGVAPAPAPLRRRRPLDELPFSPSPEVRPAFEDELTQLAALLSELIPGIKATFSSFSNIHSFSRSIYAVRNGESIVGCFACLHLNQKGLERLLSGYLSMVEPERGCLAECGSYVAAVYGWAWAMRPPTNGIRAMANLMAWLRRPEFRDAEIYTRPVTDKGLSFVQNLDFRPVDAAAEDQGLWVSTRFA